MNETRSRLIADTIAQCTKEALPQGFHFIQIIVDPAGECNATTSMNFVETLKVLKVELKKVREIVQHLDKTRN